MKRVIMVTGAGRGIGHAIAKRFAESGDHLFLLDRTGVENCEALSSLAEKAGGSITAIEADVTDAESLKSAAARAIDVHGRLDVLVNNAGILISKPTVETTQEDWSRTIAINLGGTWNGIQAALPYMLAQKSGRIINVSSELGIIGFATYAAYCASKGGVIALTKALAKELAPLGILVNTVAPGPIDTDMLKFDTVEYNDETLAEIPLRRFGRADEIAATVAFLAGPDAGYFVGQVISPNGGTAI